MKKLGQKLRILRKREGLTQTQLANMLEVDHTHVGKMERGERVPSLEILIKVTQIFNVSADTLINDELELDD